jgi:hypothetical protein
MPATLRVYSPLGREIAVLARGAGAAGRNAHLLAASSLAPGIYLYVLTTPACTSTGRIVMVR